MRTVWRDALLVTAILGLLLHATSSRVRAEDPPATFNQQIAPILYKNCTSCHHTGGAGPFSLLTYSEARRRGPQIEQVTKSRFMPPWLPTPGYGDFEDERRLSSDEIALIRRWVTSGMPEGATADAPPAPEYPQRGWTLGRPDLILSIQQPFELPSSGTDVFRNFILPYPLHQTHYIRALEIRPGTPRAVHHANLLIDRTASLRHSSAAWRYGIPGMDLAIYSGTTFDPDSHFLFWKPDTPALIEPQGMPWELDPGNDLVLNLHLKPSGKREEIVAEVGLYFTDTPPVKQPMLLQLENDSALDIPPGIRNFVVDDQLRLPVDVELLGIYPHAHYLGKELEGYAILPTGKKIWLIRIQDWDIDRQSVYRYRRPVFLPKDTVLHMHFRYDNSRENVHNPSNPPIRVREGNRSIDEMGHLWLQVLPVNTERASLDPRVILEEAWMQSRLQKDPKDTAALYNLAAIRTSIGEYSQAVDLYRKDIAANQGDVSAWNGLGVALAASGNFDGARGAYLKALHIVPNFRDARFNLAKLELEKENDAEAERQFRAVLAESPEDVAAHAGLGMTLLKEGQERNAQTEFETALKLDPNEINSLEGLSQIDLNEGRFEKAIVDLEKAVQVKKGDANLHTQLAAAYAQESHNDYALREMRIAASLSPNNSEIRALLSQLLAASNQVLEAIQEQQAALALNDRNAGGWNNLGVLELRVGNPVAAREDFERAIAVDSSLSAARANLTRLTREAR